MAEKSVAKRLRERRLVRFGERDSNPGHASPSVASDSDPDAAANAASRDEAVSRHIDTTAVTESVSAPEVALRGALVAALNAGDHALASELLKMIAKLAGTRAARLVGLLGARPER
jgi:hypothetical protein